MVAKILYEFQYSRIITNIFLILVVVGKNFLLPYYPLYLKYLQLNALEAGVVICGQYLCEMLFSPIWVYAVRRSKDSHKKRALVVLSLLLTSAIYVCFVFVPPEGNKPYDVTHCNKQSINNINTTMQPISIINEFTTMPTIETTSTKSTTTISTTTSESTTIMNFATTREMVLEPNPAETEDYPMPYDNFEDKRKKPVYEDYDNNNNNNYEDDYSELNPYRSSKYNRGRIRQRRSIDYELIKDTSWIYSSVFRAAFLLATFSSALSCLAEPSVSSLWIQRLDDAEHLEKKGEYLIWARLLSSISIMLLSILITFISPCYVARGLHQMVIHPLSASGILAGAAILGLILLPLPTGKLSTLQGIPKTRTIEPISGLKYILRSITVMFTATAVTSGSLFLLWHFSSLTSNNYNYNYELIFGGFIALEALFGVPVLGWSRSTPHNTNVIFPGRAAIGLLLLGIQFGVTPLIEIPTLLPLFGILQGLGGSLIEKSLGRSHGSSSWRLGCAIGAFSAGVTYHLLGVKPTMWGAAVLTLISAIFILITGRNVPSKRRRKAYSKLLLAETKSNTNGILIGADDTLSDSDDQETDWLERALHENQQESIS